MILESKIKFSNRFQLICLLILAAVLNINTLFNKYALDDHVVLTKNKLVLEGVKGIPKLLTTDLFYGTEGENSHLPGGRYRPFALVLFAIEYQIFGLNPYVNHLINILLFVLLIYMLYVILQYHIFKEQHHYLAFVSCLLFIVHPIHTEVIANIKSRDEIITFILLLCTAFIYIKYSVNHKRWVLALGLFCYLLALLTRESAVPFIAIVPLTAYFFYGQTIKKSLMLAVPLAFVFFVYMALRVSVIGFTSKDEIDILNTPFLYATHAEAFATKVYMLFKYLWLLIFPHPLSVDYGYNEIAYVGLGSIQFIGSLLLYLGIFLYAAYTFLRKSLFSFCILYFLITIFLFANFVINIGAPLAERLLFQPSLGFCIALAAIYLQFFSKAKIPSAILLIAICILFSIKTVIRNRVWSTNETLFFTDVEIAPNSIRTNFFAGHEYLKKGQAEENEELKIKYLNKVLALDKKVMELNPHHKYVYVDLGYANFSLHKFFVAADFWKKAIELAPGDTALRKRVNEVSDVLYNSGNRLFRKGNLDSAIICYKKSVELNDKNTDAWYNLGGSYFKKDDVKNGLDAWQNVLKLEPERKLDREKFSKTQ